MNSAPQVLERTSYAPSADGSAVRNVDALVIGAGFGGLGAAMELVERGRSVVVCETLDYPGGCASTFRRDGYLFEAGATLFSGFGEDQLFGNWIRKYDLPVEIDWLDPPVELRMPDLVLPMGLRRGDLERRLAELPGAPRESLARFFAYQARVADTLWELLDQPELLPPLGPRALLAHSRRLHRYLPFARLVGRPLSTVLSRFGLADFKPLRVVLDALCQITVQCGIEEAEAPFALSVMDYLHRGTGHVRGGIGVLARALVGAIEDQGGEVRLTCRVRGLCRDGDAWLVDTRRGPVRARTVLANLLPQDLARILGHEPPVLRRPAARVEEGWGACMLYRVVRPPANAGPEAHHLEMVQDTEQAFVEGNHLFASISGAHDLGRAPEGLRTMTVSTHVPLAELNGLPDGEAAARVTEIQERMRRGLATLAPEWESVEHELTASPRTFQRFTGRHAGFVGGIPRRAGLAHYRQLGPLSVERGLWLVGDTAFPGQSTLATATGGVRAAAAADRRLH